MASQSTDCPQLDHPPEVLYVLNAQQMQELRLVAYRLGVVYAMTYSQQSACSDRIRAVLDAARPVAHDE